MTPQPFFKSILRWSCAGICAVGIAAPAYAQYATNRYRQMDGNNDGMISRGEWRGSEQSFRRHDWNNDGVLSGDELRVGARRRDNRTNDEDWRDQSDDWRNRSDDWRNRSEVSDWTPEAFQRMDDNRDGVISEREWRFDEETFLRVDRNDDGVISEREFRGDTNDQPQSAAYDAGHDRGLVDGRRAGREDKVRRNTWDLDGQRELEHADAGYRSTMGPREDYQAGYRDAFIRGYREGFGPR